MNKILQGDCIEQLRTLPDGIVQTCITSPPYYGLRSYCEEAVMLKPDTPEWVLKEIESLGIKPFGSNV